MAEEPGARSAAGRGVARTVLAIVYALVGVEAALEAAGTLRGDGAPRTLGALQTLGALVAFATAWGSWRGARWAPAGALLYGLVVGAMIVALGPMLGLGADERRGLWAGAATMVLFGVVTAWFLRRALARTQAPVA